MADFIDIAATSDIALGRARSFDAGGRIIALYHTTSGFFATDNVCPHRGGPLAEGDLIGDEINCPWHLWGFDVKTGKCGGNPEISVATHELRVDGERILVRVP
ncbi:MAG TPA: Rieske 2Fe-2S domain-containing protein [Thermoanaerobaculia bacterium]|jgi:nitrite reductase (NADH) small subunit|nr:Rieske 2Fe-2S domain-containing protein [Thermoanaerobaculia bacterium]